MFGYRTISDCGSPPLYTDYLLSKPPAESSSSSPAARSIPSGRKGSKKVRTGCVTCKIRKVKCDETKPFCQRCTKTGRKCDGYLDPRAWSTRRSLKEVAPHDHILGTLRHFAEPEEKRALWFFQHCTAPCISGDGDAGFWKTVVLQICQTEPAVRHAVLAVSSLHEALSGSIPFAGGFANGSIARPQQAFALQQYNKAISRLLEQMNSPLTKPLASLLTCVLFVCIEYMQGKDKEALIHLEQGRQLLAQLDRRSNDREMKYINHHIVPLFTHLSLTSFLFSGSSVSVPAALNRQRGVPDTFHSLDDYRHAMHEFMEQAFHFSQRARPAKSPNDLIPRETMQLLESERDRLLARLAKLNVAFSLFRASRSNPGPENAHLVLQMYLHAQHIWISTALSSSEVVYDDFLSSFAAIVPLAAAYLDQESPSQRRAALSPESLQYLAAPEQLSVAHSSNFTFETHIVPPLYYVAAKCRHPLIRRSALDLLRRCPFRRENIWRASVMGSLADHIVSLEERWARGQSPNQMMHARTNAHETSICSSSMEANQSLARVSTTAGSNPISALNLEAAVDPILYLEADLSLSLSQPPLFTTSFDDSYSSSSGMEPTMAFLGPPIQSATWHWQQQQQQQQQHRFQHHGAHPAGQMSYSASISYDTTQAPSPQGHMGNDSVDYSSHSSGSEISSMDLEEQSRYQSMVHGYSPPQQYLTPPPRQRQTQQQRADAQEVSMEAAPSRQRSPIPNNLAMEAPFGLPEELRLHDAIVGPEREEGTWVTVFRQLHGVDAAWDFAK